LRGGGESAAHGSACAAPHAVQQFRIHLVDAFHYRGLEFAERPHVADARPRGIFRKAVRVRIPSRSKKRGMKNSLVNVVRRTRPVPPLGDEMRGIVGVYDLRSWRGGWRVVDDRVVVGDVEGFCGRPAH